jgi:hypothetical protein
MKIKHFTILFILLLILFFIGNFVLTQDVWEGDLNTDQLEEFYNSKSTKVSGNVTIRKSQFTDLSLLSHLVSIDGDLNIGFDDIHNDIHEGNDSLINLKGLQNLKIVGGKLSIYQNKALKNIQALTSLVSVGNLKIKNCESLESLNGLNNLKEIKEKLTLSDNEKLANFTGINSQLLNSLNKYEIQGNAYNPEVYELKNGQFVEPVKVVEPAKELEMFQFSFHNTTPGELENLVQAKIKEEFFSYIDDEGGDIYYYEDPSDEDYREYYNRISNLTLTGNIDARDYNFVRYLDSLSFLDLRGVNILAYDDFPANEIPGESFIDAAGFKHLSELILPESLTSLDDYALNFWDDSHCIKRIAISKSISHIGKGALCNVNEIHVDADNPNYCVIDGVVYTKDRTELIRCPLQKTGSFTMPETVKTIRAFAFENCSNISAIQIPLSVLTIGHDAFIYCDGIRKITIPTSISKIERSTFCGCSNLTEIFLPETIRFIEEGAFAWCPKLVHINLPEGISEIPKNSFEGCTALQRIQLPSSTTLIDERAFESCSGLKEIVLPNSLHTIGQFAFKKCIALETIKFNLALKHIKEDAFYNCGINDLVLGQNIECIDKGAFRECARLTSVQINSKELKMGIYVFADCENLTHVSFNSEIDSLSGNTFYNCSALVDVVLPEALKEIPGFFFHDCKALQEITIPVQVTTIKYAAFMGCEGLTTVHFKTKSLKKLESEAFAKCKSLSSIIIPNSVTTIDYECFEACDNLQNIQLSSNLTYFPSQLFAECTKLENLIVPASVTQFSDFSFKESNLKKVKLLSKIPAEIKGKGFFQKYFIKDLLITVPKKSKQTYQQASGWNRLSIQ